MSHNSLNYKLNFLLNELNIYLSEEQKNNLMTYIGLLKKWNNTYNLTSIRDPDEMLIKHVVDSLAVSHYLEGQKFIDVGTGAGLPGVPLAIAYPERHFTLIDSRAKKVHFLRQVQAELAIKNINPIQNRVETFFSDIPFDGILSRAFSSLTEMLLLCKHLIGNENNGVFYALKGRNPTKEISEISSDFVVQSVIPLVIPGLDAERHLVIIKSSLLKPT